MTKLRPKCPKCGSHNLGCDAYAYWDVDAQEWRLNSTYDAIDCMDCGASDIRTIWEEVDEDYTAQDKLDDLAICERWRGEAKENENDVQD